MAAPVSGTTTVPQAADAMSQLASMLQLAGGTVRTQNAGEIGDLQAVLAGLRAQDPNAQLASIFQQASGQIPGLQSALSNAIGARSGGNSAVSAALQKLLQQTTLAGQQQIAQQQQQNFQTQAQAASAVAQATKGTRETSGVNQGEAAKNLAILQLLSKSGILKELGLGTQDAPAVATPVTGGAVNAQPAAGLDLSTFGSNVGFTPDASFSPAAGLLDSGVDSGIDWSFADGWDSSPTDMTGFQTPTVTETPTYEAPPSVYLPEEEFTLPMFADGGLVTAQGGRRGAAPSVTQTAPTGTTAQQGAAQLQGPDLFQVLQAAVNELGSVNSSGSGTAGSGLGTGVTPATGNAGTGPASPAVSKGLATAANINALSGLTGGPALRDNGMLGLAANLSRAATPEKALATMGTFAANKAVPGLGGAIQFAANPSVQSGVNLAMSLNPVSAAANVLAGMFGLPSAGEMVNRGVENYQLGTEVNPSASMLDRYSVGSDINASNDPLGALISALDQQGSGGGGGGGDFGDRGPGGSSGDTAAAAAGANAAGPGLANGGEVDGPGTGTSDSIKARLSDGEYVIPADVVEKLGVQFFDQLRNQFHTPAAQAAR